jgi:hypothetical protein
MRYPPALNWGFLLPTFLTYKGKTMKVLITATLLSVSCTLTKPAALSNSAVNNNEIDCLAILQKHEQSLSY